MAYEGFRPDITPLDAPFWDALRRHELVVQQCDDVRAAAVRAQRALPQLRLAVGDLDAGQRRRDRVHVLDRPPRADTRVPGRRARTRSRTSSSPKDRACRRAWSTSRPTRSRSACRSRSCSTTSTTTSPCTASGPRVGSRIPRAVSWPACQSIRAMRCDAGTACSAPCSSSSTATIPYVPCTRSIHG